MPAKDVIISAFATPPRSSDRAIAQDLSLFTDPPIVLGVDPMMQPGEFLASAGFVRTAAYYKAQSADGSILGPIIKQRLKGIEVRSVTIIGFSAGNIFVQKVLETSDAKWIDGVIALDGAVAQKVYGGAWYQPDVETWASFAALAAKNERLFVNAFTAIPAPSKQIGSTSESAGAIYDLVRDKVPQAPVTPTIDLSLLSEPPPPPSVTISVDRPTTGGGTEKISRTWDTMPVPDIFNWGNAWNLFYGGTEEPDHIFMSRYAQRAIWKTFLAPRFNSGIHCSTESMAGLGRALGQDGAGCKPNKKILAPDVYPTDSPWPGLAAVGGGLAVGIGMGYFFGRLIGD